LNDLKSYARHKLRPAASQNFLFENLPQTAGISCQGKNFSYGKRFPLANYGKGNLISRK